MQHPAKKKRMAAMLTCWKLPSLLGGRLDTRRRLAVSFLLTVIRCQTSWISPEITHVTIVPTYFIRRRDSSQSSSQPKRREVHLSRKNPWNDLLMASHLELWLGRLSVRAAVPQNPLGILFAVHMGVSRGPLTLCPLCPWRAKHKSLH